MWCMLVFSEISCCHFFPMYGGELWWQCAVLNGLAQICCKTLFFVDPLINCDSEVVNFILIYYFFYFT